MERREGKLVLSSLIESSPYQFTRLGRSKWLQVVPLGNGICGPEGSVRTIGVLLEVIVWVQVQLKSSSLLFADFLLQLLLERERRKDHE